MDSNSFTVVIKLLSSYNNAFRKRCTLISSDILKWKVRNDTDLDVSTVKCTSSRRTAIYPDDQIQKLKAFPGLFITDFGI